MSKNLDLFNAVDFHGKAVMIFEQGEFISTRFYYQMAVNLYVMPGFMVEVYYSQYLNKIERIEVLKEDKQIERHLDQIELTDFQ